MFVLARFSPYEWDNPYPCIEEPEELENQFSLSNSFWFTIGSLMQQGSDVAPISLSTRLVAGVWFFFAMIVIASYTANLAAFLTVVTLDKPIESAEDLAAQTEIKYGTLEGGSTMNFFKTSSHPVFKTMWDFMSGPMRSEIMTSSNTAGVNKVVEENGGYAYLMESASIQYIIERNCKVTQIGGNLDNKGYGIAITPETPYKPYIDSAILQLQEGGILHKLKIKWWKQKRGGGQHLQQIVVHTISQWSLLFQVLVRHRRMAAVLNPLALTTLPVFSSSLWADASLLRESIDHPEIRRPHKTILFQAAGGGRVHVWCKAVV